MLGSFQLKESQGEFNILLMEALAKELNRELKKLPKKLTKPFQESVANVFRETDIFDSLLYGELRGMFGFPYATENLLVGSILTAIKDDLHIEFSEVFATSASFIGGLNVYVVKKTLQDILQAKGAEFDVDLSAKSTINSYPNLLENEPITKFNIPWIKWLLLDGDKVQVSNFTFIGGEGKGRSNKGIMAATKNESRWFRLPKEYAGTINDNWITRTLDHYVSRFEGEWSVLIQKELL